MTDERPYSVAMLAERWRCSARTIRGMIDRGELAHFRLGGRLLRIAAAEVARWERTGERQPDTSPSGLSGDAPAPRGAKTAADAAFASLRSR